MRKIILIGGFASLLVVALAEETHPQYQGWVKSMPPSVIRPQSSKLQHFRMKLKNGESL